MSTWRAVHPYGDNSHQQRAHLRSPSVHRVASSSKRAGNRGWPLFAADQYRYGKQADGMSRTNTRQGLCHAETTRHHRHQRGRGGDAVGATVRKIFQDIPQAVGGIRRSCTHRWRPGYGAHQQRRRTSRRTSMTRMGTRRVREPVKHRDPRTRFWSTTRQRQHMAGKWVHRRSMSTRHCTGAAISPLRFEPSTGGLPRATRRWAREYPNEHAYTASPIQDIRGRTRGTRLGQRPAGRRRAVLPVPARKTSACSKTEGSARRSGTKFVGRLSRPYYNMDQCVGRQ